MDFLIFPQTNLKNQKNMQENTSQIIRKNSCISKKWSEALSLILCIYLPNSYPDFQAAGNSTQQQVILLFAFEKNRWSSWWSSKIDWQCSWVVQRVFEASKWLLGEQWMASPWITASGKKKTTERWIKLLKISGWKHTPQFY